jgi:hypothetical protein
MKPYVTLSETMNELRKEGYTEDFNLQQTASNAVTASSRYLLMNLKLTNIIASKARAIHQMQQFYMLSLRIVIN